VCFAPLRELGPRHELQDGGVDAETTFSAGGVVEDMTQMGAAGFGDHFGAVHAEAVVGPFDDGTGLRPVEAEPTGVGVEAISAVEEDLTGESVDEDPVAHVFEDLVFFAESRFGSFVEGDVVGFAACSQFEGAQGFVELFGLQVAGMGRHLFAVDDEVDRRRADDGGFEFEAFDAVLVGEAHGDRPVVV